MQGAHDYIPGTNYVSMVYKVRYTLWSIFMAHELLFPVINILYLNILQLLLFLSLLCRLFTIMYLEQTMSLWYIKLQLFSRHCL
jgi:hypothetical protein